MTIGVHEREDGETQGVQRVVCTGRGYVSVYYIYTPSVLRSRRSVPPSGLRCPPDELVDLVAMLDWRIFAVLAAVCLYDGWVSPPAPAASCRATEPIPVRHRRPLANALRNGRAVLHV